jgi:transcriptional regulator with XRE-family HTH domain
MPAKPDPRRATSVDVTVARNVRMWRIARGLSQTQLADRIGVTFQQVQKYESGDNRISTGRLTKIARVLGVGVMTLLDGTDQAAAPADVHSRVLIQSNSALRLAHAFSAIPQSRRKLRTSLVVMVEQLAAAAARQARRRRR